MVKFIQLPVPDPRHTYSEGNVPLAAGYLAASLTATGIPATILPREAADHGGDAAVLDWILSEPLEVLGITCFMWNLERSLWLARRVREARPGCRIVLGGVEMVADHPLVANEPVDAVVVGEGEEFLAAWITAPGVRNPEIQWLCSPPPQDLASLPDPYLEGVLMPRRNAILFVETMRGCPYNCQYCLYSKRQTGLRFFPPRRIEALFRLAREARVSEIYLMDPSFNLTPNLEKRLVNLADWNSTGIPLHSEIRLEAVTPGMAAAMGRAGFHSVEAGLQSTNPAALAEVSRSWDREKFIRGARLLREQGIRIHTGVILGLPKDGVTDFLRTLDFVMNLGLAEDMEIYPLSLLPGTRLRARAKALGLHFQDRPPYQVTATPEMGADELSLAVAAAEDRLGIEFHPPMVPAFANQPGGFVEYLDLRSSVSDRVDITLPDPKRVANRLSIRLAPYTPNQVTAAVAAWLRNHNPFTLVQLVVDTGPIPDLAWCRHLAERFQQGDNYYDRLHIYVPSRGLGYSVRVFHLTADPRALERHMRIPQACDPVFRYTPGILETVHSLLEERPALLIETPLQSKEKKQLERVYRGFEYMMTDIT